MHQFTNIRAQYRAGSLLHGALVRVGLFFLLLICCLAACAPFASSPQPTPTSTVQQTPVARLTYVALGASDTYGTGADDPQTQNWAFDLAGLLGNGVQVHLVNLGIPGIHLHAALNVELPVALDSHANLITVWLAVNDIADGVPVANYQPDLDQLLTRLTAASPHARIAVANVPDLTLLPRFAGTDTHALHDQIAAYNSAIATTVARHQVILVDLFQRWNELAAHPEYISSDGFHPNALGYSKLADIFYQVLQGKG